MLLRCLLAAAGMCILLAVGLSAQGTYPGMSGGSKTISLKPDYLTPSEIIKFLGVETSGKKGIMEWVADDRQHYAEVRYNDAANLLVISGPVGDVEFVKDLIKKADIPPRQIEIEVVIFEVNTSMARDIGIDWDIFWRQAAPRVGYDYRYDHDDSRMRDYNHQYRNEIRDGILYHSSDYEQKANMEDRNKRESHDLIVSSDVDLGRVISILDEEGAATVRNVPRILTLNNRRATILDGQRVTYTTSYSTYGNIYETDTMDAGLNLSIVPSLGESGYITMDIIAELTSLERTDRGGPVKVGQMVENMVVVRDGESVLLGGLTRNIEQTSKKRLPLLGHLIPFLFSREVTYEDKYESIIILTPRVVDFETALDEGTRGILEGETP